jgi:hydroxymethylpyrimidine/phosphomethylpyrimidine kinase
MSKTPGSHPTHTEGMPPTERQVALTIAGFDPGSGAGVTADLKVFAANNIYGMAAITALTVQSTMGVRRSEPVGATLLRETLDCLADDVAFAGIKIGMLGSAENVEAVASFLEAGAPSLPGRSKVVLDPVLRSSSGRELLEGAGIFFLKNRLLPRIGWVTPNWEELSALIGRPIESRESVISGAKELQALAAAAGNPELNVVVTGGEQDHPDDYLLIADGTGNWLRGEHIATSATHGTGCAFSTALLCGLMAGFTPYDAAADAKAYVAMALKNAYPIGHGKGPMHHLFRFTKGI